VSLVLDMKLVLTSCAKASKLECRRERLADQLKYFDLGGLRCPSCWGCLASPGCVSNDAAQLGCALVLACGCPTWGAGLAQELENLALGAAAVAAACICALSSPGCTCMYSFYSLMQLKLGRK